MTNMFTSDLSGREFPETDRVPAKLLRPSIFGMIRKEHPDFGAESFLSVTELNFYRGKYIEGYLLQEVGELSELENAVVLSLKEKSTLADKIDQEKQIPSTRGQIIADKVASFGGSWPFIIMFGIFLLIWISVNTLWLANRGFDPYPFILLNLILSCIAAMQAPVIMMSQNRQEEKDRERAKMDYMINLKSELEIRILHEKIDHLIMNQELEMIQIQKEQIGMLNDILKKIG
jgi:uncharacterized membrane protein